MHSTVCHVARSTEVTNESGSGSPSAINHMFMLVLAIILLMGNQSAGAEQITIRLSYKLILNPVNGNMPVLPSIIASRIAWMNSQQQGYFRGFRFELAEPVQQVGAMGDLSGPSKWSSVNLRTDIVKPNPALPPLGALAALENEALANKVLYKWNDNAVNIYVNLGTTGGKCSFPSHWVLDADDHIIAVGPGGGNATHLHEIGHYFGLFHTHEKDFLGLGGEGISDTIIDDPSWNQDRIARENYGRINSFPPRTDPSVTFSSLSPERQEKVLDVWQNIMSYHGNRVRLTEGQLDRWTVGTNFPRRRVVTGRTIFVDSGATWHQPGTQGSGLYSNRPLRKIEDALAMAKRNDILLLKPGTYSGGRIIDKPVTIRATRQGPVVLR